HAHDWEAAIAATSFVPDEVVAQLCEALGLIGTAEDCATRIGELTKLGVRNLYLMPLETFTPPRREIAAFRDVVFPRLAAAACRYFIRVPDYSRTRGREAGRVPSSGAGERSRCVTHSPESQPSGLRTGFGGPTPPERSPAPAATRPDRTCGAREWSTLASGFGLPEPGVECDEAVGVHVQLRGEAPAIALVGVDRVARAPVDLLERLYGQPRK